MTGWTLRVELCPPEVREAALQVLYQHLPELVRSRLVTEVLREATYGQIDLSGLWIAWNSPPSLGAARIRIIGALLTQPLAGRAAAIWVPEVAASWRRAKIAAALVHSALADIQARGFRIAQAILDESASRRGAVDLIRGGMPRVTELIYLDRGTHIPLRQSTNPHRPKSLELNPLRLAWRHYEAAVEAEFRALLQATYVSSLDMPELEGVRSLDDVIEGHRATGRFVPERWQVGQVPGEPDTAVVLLLSEVPDRDVWEVVYLGLTVPARGRGLGFAAIARALELARPHASRLELAVDIRNLPAIRLYESAGFEPFDRRSVHLAVFPENVA